MKNKKQKTEMSIGMKIWFTIGFIISFFMIIFGFILNTELLNSVENILLGLFLINFFCTPVILCIIQDSLNKKNEKHNNKIKTNN